MAYHIVIGMNIFNIDIVFRESIFIVHVSTLITYTWVSSPEPNSSGGPSPDFLGPGLIHSSPPLSPSLQVPRPSSSLLM